MAPRRTLRSDTDKQSLSPSLSLDDLKKHRRPKRNCVAKRLDIIDLEGGEILELRTPTPPYHVRYPDIFSPARIPRPPRVFTDCYKKKVKRFMELSQGNPQKHGVFESDKWFRNLAKSLRDRSSKAVVVKDIRNWIHYFPEIFAMGTGTDNSQSESHSSSEGTGPASSTVSRDDHPDPEDQAPRGDSMTTTVSEMEQSAPSADLVDAADIDLPEAPAADLPEASDIDLPEAPAADLPETSAADLPEATAADFPEISAADLHDVLHWTFGEVPGNNPDSLTDEGGTSNQSRNPLTRETGTVYETDPHLSGRSSVTSGIESIDEVNVGGGALSSTLEGLDDEHCNGTFAVPMPNAKEALGNENPPGVAPVMEVGSAVVTRTSIGGGEIKGQTVIPITPTDMTPLTPAEVTDEYLLSLIATPTLGEYHAELAPPNPAVTLPQQPLIQGARAQSQNQWGQYPKTGIPFPSTHLGLPDLHIWVGQGSTGTDPALPTHSHSRFDQQHQGQQPSAIQTLLHHSEGVLNALSQLRVEAPYNPINSLPPAIENVELAGKLLHSLAKMM